MPPKRTSEAASAARTGTAQVGNRDSRLPTPGTAITREYKERTLQVVVLADDFDFQGNRYRTLSAVARAVQTAFETQTETRKRLYRT